MKDSKLTFIERVTVYPVSIPLRTFCRPLSSIDIYFYSTWLFSHCIHAFELSFKSHCNALQIVKVTFSLLIFAIFFSFYFLYISNLHVSKLTKRLRNPHKTNVMSTWSLTLEGNHAASTSSEWRIIFNSNFEIRGGTRGIPTPFPHEGRRVGDMFLPSHKSSHFRSNNLPGSISMSAFSQTLWLVTFPSHQFGDCFACVVLVYKYALFMFS